MTDTKPRSTSEVALARAIDRARKGKALTVTELGRRAGIDRNHLGQRLRGKSPMLLSVADQLAEVMGFTISVTLVPKRSEYEQPSD